MLNEFSRTELLLGREGMEALSNASVAVFGTGETGSACVEALARSGVGGLLLADPARFETIDASLTSSLETLGIPKAEAAAVRVADISRKCRTEIWTEPDALPNLSGCAYVVDALEGEEEKLRLIQYAFESGIPVLSCLDMKKRLDVTRLQVGDVSKAPGTEEFRRALRFAGIKKLKAVFSSEIPSAAGLSMPFVPEAAGLIAAGEVIKDLLKKST